MSDAIQIRTTRGELPLDDARVDAALLEACRILKAGGWICEHASIDMNGNQGRVATIEMRFLKPRALMRA